MPGIVTKKELLNPKTSLLILVTFGWRIWLRALFAPKGKPFLTIVAEENLKAYLKNMEITNVEIAD